MGIIAQAKQPRLYLDNIPLVYAYQMHILLSVCSKNFLMANSFMVGRSTLWSSIFHGISVLKPRSYRWISSQSVSPFQLQHSWICSPSGCFGRSTKSWVPGWWILWKCDVSISNASFIKTLMKFYSLPLHRVIIVSADNFGYGVFFRKVSSYKQQKLCVAIKKLYEPFRDEKSALRVYRFEKFCYIFYCINFQNKHYSVQVLTFVKSTIYLSQKLTIIL